MLAWLHQLPAPRTNIVSQIRLKVSRDPSIIHQQSETKTKHNSKKQDLTNGVKQELYAVVSVDPAISSVMIASA